MGTTIRHFVSSTIALAVLVGGVLIPFPAEAAIIAYNVADGQLGNQAFTGSLGLDFDVLAPTGISVLSLGVFDAGQNGIGSPINDTLFAQIYDRGTQSAVPNSFLSFTNADPGTLMGGSPGGSRFKDLPSPVTLGAGQYSIVAWGFSSLDLHGNYNCVSPPGCGFNNPFALSITDDGGGLIAFVGSGRFDGTAGVYPASVPPGLPVNVFHAGTFAYAPVPEPGTLLLLGSGLVGVGAAARNRNRRKLT